MPSIISNQVKYYEILSLGSHNHDPSGIISSGKHDIKGFNEYRFTDCEYISDWPEGIVFNVRGQYEEDYLIVRLHWTVVSYRVKKVFDDCQVKGVQFLPVHVILENTGKEIGPYYAVNVLQAFDALDWEHTIWMNNKINPRDHKYPNANILYAALHNEPIQGIDIFRLTIQGNIDVRIFISARVVNSLVKSNATIGFKFIPVRSY
jgi:hypothetical protein